MFYKEIICLANSRKPGGRCIAGKCVTSGVWVRPVSSFQNGTISIPQMTCVNNVVPRVLDVIKIPFEEHKPLFYQPENILITANRWEIVGRYDQRNLSALYDNPLALWRNEPYINKMPIKDLATTPVNSSLLFIKVSPLILQRVNGTNDFGSTTKKVRAIFTYNGVRYDLPVTDLEIENSYRGRPQGNYIVEGESFSLCVSLGEPYDKDGCSYKLVAAIIPI